ncbi:hypothetical protein Fmac_014159 [Flemingia macrophylla]|uniref:Uncharacterized protein n=1 Tax=Flemingia macrophylla TaxID=520843 RepID=A0ABD1MAY3_9FABA
MFPKRFRDPKTGFHLLSSMYSKKYLKNIGLEREDYYFLKRVGNGLLCTYAVLGALWLYKDNSSLGWWKLKEHEEAVKEFFAKGKIIGTTIGAKVMAESDKDGNHNQKELQGKNFDEESQKLWLRLKNEITTELKEKGLDVE